MQDATKKIKFKGMEGKELSMDFQTRQTQITTKEGKTSFICFADIKTLYGVMKAKEDLEHQREQYNIRLRGLDATLIS